MTSASRWGHFNRPVGGIRNRIHVPHMRRDDPGQPPNIPADQMKPWIAADLNLRARTAHSKLLTSGLNQLWDSVVYQYG